MAGAAGFVGGAAVGHMVSSSRHLAPDAQCTDLCLAMLHPTAHQGTVAGIPSADDRNQMKATWSLNC